MARLKRSEQLAAMGSGTRDERPAEDFVAFHERSRTRDPDYAYEIVRVLTTLWALTFFRARTISSEKVPQSGPIILAPNHGSFMDHFFLGGFLRRKVQLHGEVAALPAAAAVRVLARRRVPGPPRPP